MNPKKDLIIKGFIGLFIAVIVFSIFSGGEKLDKALKKQAKAIPSLIDDAKSRVDALQDKYKSLKKSKEYKKIQTFAQKENWDKQFQLAHDTLKRAKVLYDKDLYPLIKKNKPEVAEPVKQEIKRIKMVIEEAEKTAQKPAARFAMIKKTITNVDVYNKTAAENQAQISQIITGIQAGVIAKTLVDFPDLTKIINAQFAPASKLNQDSSTHLKTIKEQYASHASGKETDYAAFTDSFSALNQGLVQAQALKTSLKEEMSQLYTSYTKILKDMKEDLYVTIRRESWDEKSDYYNPQFTNFTRQVSSETYEALTSNTIDTIGTVTAGFSGSRFSNNVGKAWDELKINPGDNWPTRKHNAATFWVEDTKETYYHKYILEKDGETTETDWEKVDESVYEANLEFLGMAILAKPYGTFEKDQMTQAAPPGMAYVGNEKYGEWKKDNTGNQFWSWYGRYAFFSMLFSPRPYYYGYNSWSGWNNNYRHSRPYFGQNQNGVNKYGTYGSAVKKSPKFQSTNFAKSGGLKSQTASVRGAGASLRGGGPKSKGK